MIFNYKTINNVQIVGKIISGIENGERNSFFTVETKEKNNNKIFSVHHKITISNAYLNNIKDLVVVGNYAFVYGSLYYHTTEIGIREVEIRTNDIQFFKGF